MSSSLFSDQSENIDPFKASRVSEDNERSVGQSSIVREDHSLIPNLHRLCLSCHAFLWTRLSRLLTLAFFALLDLARRLKQIRPATLASPSSTSTLDDPISLSSIQSSRSVGSDSNSMTHLLVHPPLHRSENIRIHANKSSTTDSSCHPRVHSVDENFLFSKSESNDLLQLIQRFTSEPQLSYCFSLSSPSINEDRSSTIEPVTNIDDRPSDNVDVIYPNEMIAELPSTTATAESTSDAGDEDALIETNDNNASVNQIERHFRRRKRRPSLTRVCASTHDTQELPRIENLDINNNLQESPSSSESSETPLSPPSTPGTITDLRSRRLRQRFYRRRSTSNASPPLTSPTVEFFVPTEPSAVTPPPSPTSPPASTSSSGGKLKRTGSLGNSIKKMVRFADSIGRELAQVQYIQSTADEENAVTPKQSLYGSKYTDFEPKPWSFEVALNSRPLIEHPKPKRFFCLYRQPNSEHPDIYLHDVWKNQVKLEYADIRSKPSGDLFLSGTLWVTNASYFKYVTVKYTFNQWMNSYEHEATHRCHSNDFRNLDQFEFQIDLPNDVDRIDFVLRYCVNYQEYWDNNEGRNYTLQSETSSTPQTLISLPHDCDFNEMRFY